jgi:hypothetical protein
MVEVPAVTAVTIPLVDPTVATPGVALSHVPPEGLPVSETVVVPTVHKRGDPEMEGVALTLIVLVVVNEHTE